MSKNESTPPVSKDLSKDVSKERIKKGKANEIDAYVGKRLRLRRMMLGLSQEKIADAVGLTFQQVQKYERGSNRIGAGRLYEFSQALQVPIQYFFEVEEGGKSLQTLSKKGSVTGLAEEKLFHGMHPSPHKETTELLRAFYRIPDPKIRRRLFELTRSLGETFSELPPAKDVGKAEQ